MPFLLHDKSFEKLLMSFLECDILKKNSIKTSAKDVMIGCLKENLWSV